MKLTLHNDFLKAIELFFYHHRDRLVYVHMAMFVLFILLITIPLFLPTPAENAIILNNFTKLSNFLMWGLWFPLVFVSVIFTGRSWCGLLCPMGAASEWANKKGFQLKIPAWIRWEGTPIISFILITIGGQTIGVRDYPQAIAIVFGSMMGAAIIIGLFFGKNKRVWCRHICPIGLLLGVFSRIGMLDFTPKRKKPVKDRYTEKGLCPTMIKISCKDESRHCIECFRCVNPESQGGLTLKWRAPGAEIEDIKNHNPNLAEIWFLFLSTGAVLGGFLWLTHSSYQIFRKSIGEWFMDNGWYGIFNIGPSWLMSVHPDQREVFSWLDFTSISLYMLVCMMIFALILSISTLISTWITKHLGGSGAIFTQLSYQYMPIAMISIVIGLGGQLFDALSLFGLSKMLIAYIKMTFFAAAILWSIHIGYRILSNMKISKYVIILPIIPSSLCSITIGYAWYLAIF